MVRSPLHSLTSRTLIPIVGLSRPSNSYRTTDDVAARYEKVSQSSREFLIIQFGLACFNWDPESQAYIAKAFNFYIFPNGEPREAGERFFTCSSSSLTFLMECNFDFNKMVKEGISYLTDDEADSYLERINVARVKEGKIKCILLEKNKWAIQCADDVGDRRYCYR